MARKRRNEDEGGEEVAADRREEEAESSVDEELSEEDEVDEAAVEEMMGKTQTAEEARILRRDYRKLQSDLETNKLEWVKSDSDGLVQAIERANDLYQKVITTQEAALDAKILVQAAELAMQKVVQMKLSGKSLDPSEFVNSIADKFFTNAHEPVFDWASLGSVSCKFLRRAPTSDFMYGPLAAEPKSRKEQKRTIHRLEKDKSELIRPQELKESDIVKQENETSKTVLRIAKILKKEPAPFHFIKFFVNPESFSQTIENLFYISFLVRDGTVSIFEDEDGQPMIVLWDAERESEQTQDASKKEEGQQFILDITYDMWRDMIEAFDITESKIPTRNAAVKASAGSKWYG